MNISQVNYEKIKNYLHKALLSNKDINIEFEALIKPQGKYAVGKINKDEFTRLFNYFTSINFKNITNPDTESLDISSNTANGFRITLLGIDTIVAYCKDNIILNKKKKTIIRKSLIKNMEAIQLENYDIKYNLKVEDNLKHMNEEDTNAKIELIQNSLKYYRFKKRYSFESTSKFFRIDMTIVKSSSQKAVSLIESGIFNQNEKYEVEIELQRENIKRKTTDDISHLESVIIDECLGLTGQVLMVINDSDYLISFDENTRVLQAYLKLAFPHNSNVDRALSKPSDYFLGPKPITLELKNLLEPTKPEIISILKDYTVTDKADGERCLLYVHANKNVYLINNRLQITNTGLKHEHINSIIDGEYMIRNKAGPTNDFLCFDIYTYMGLDVSKFPLIDEKNKKNRFKFLEIFLDEKFDKTLSNMRVDKKKFYHGDGEEILKHSKKILDQLDKSPYNTDGLIYTPKSFPVGSVSQSEIHRKMIGSWSRLFKWKPDNTIDFLVKFIDIEFNKEAALGSSGNDNLIAYQKCSLFVGNYSSDIPIDVITILDKGLEISKKMENSEFIPQIYTECLIPIKNGNVYTNEGEIFTDQSVIEFSYINNEEISELFRWIPRNIRKDKTDLYQKTHSIIGTANALIVVENIMRSIKFPVTEAYISGQERIPEDIINDPDIYYARETDRYNSLSKNMADFHNYWVKNKYLYSKFGQNGIIKGKLFEIACGKGGDLNKWINQKISHVVGIDISLDNIINSKDGIYKRYLNQIEKIENNKQKMIFINMSATEKWDSDYINSLKHEESKKLAQNLWGISNNYANISKLSEFNNMITKKFEIVSIQFAIHYAFKNESTLNNFIFNLDSILINEGYFIGTCLDGFLVNKRLSKEDKIQGIEYGKITWQIEKRYKTYDINNHNNNIGKEIEVYVETINQSIIEYLVDFNLLVSKLAEKNIKLITNETKLKEINLKNSSDTFESIYRYYRKSIEDRGQDLTSSQKEFSFMNRYFIFVKQQ